MLTATIKGMLAHKLRAVLTSLSIALGVAFLAGTLMLTDSMQRAFDDIFGELNAGTDVAVRTEAAPDSGATPTPVTDSLLPTVRSVDGVASAEGQVSGYALLTDVNGRPIQSGVGVTVGSSLSVEEDLRGSVSLRSGRAPTRTGEVAINAGSATKGDIALGSRIKILFQGPAEEFTVVGIVEFDGEDDLGGATDAFFDTTTAQRVLGKTGVYDTIVVEAATGVSEKALARRVSSALPAGIEAVTGKALAEEASAGLGKSLGIVNKALLVFAGVALFVGSFIIWNTFAMQVTQRTRELALLRAIGATRRQVMRNVLVEAFLLGLTASALGLGLGLGVARGLPLVLSGFGLSLPTATPRIQVTTVLAALLVGTAVTLVAAIAPALRATRVLPVEALRDATPGADRFSHRRLILGVLVAGLGVAALFAGLFAGAAPIVIGIGIVGVILGVTTLAPLVAGPLAAAIGWPLQARGVPGELARQNAMRNPKRTASTAMALVIGLSLVVSVSVFAASLKASIHDILRGSTSSDLYLLPASAMAPFSREGAQVVRAADGVALVSETSNGEARFAGGVAEFASLDPATVENVVELGMTAGSIRDLGVDGVVVSKSKADAQHWKVGDLVPVEFGQTGKQSLRVEGIYSKKAYFDADYLISLPAHQKREPGIMDTAAFVKVAPGANVKQVQDRLSKLLAAEHPDTKVVDQAGYEKAEGASIDKLLGLVTVLLLLAVLIALLGIVNTLALSVFERTRELGLLRAVGMTRNQVRAMVRWESVVISVVGATLGAVLGVGLGIAMTRALADQGIESIAIPGPQLFASVVLAGVAGVLAAVGPARRAAKVDVLRAVVTD
jgi:putative ABC transport system permease protein